MCKFCEALSWKKKFARASHKQYPDHRSVYSVALVDRIFVKGRKGGSCGTSVDYRNKGCGYQLNFCPECGKYLKRSRELSPRCFDCGLPYPFPDLVLPDEVWMKISPESGTLNGLLCPTCIAARLDAKGLWYDTGCYKPMKEVPNED